MRFEKDLTKLASEAMTPMPLVTAKAGITLADAEQMMHVNKIEKLPIIDDNGFLTAKPISALIIGSILDLQLTGFYAGQKLDGKIVIEESLTPFNEKNAEREIKIAGDTGILCTVEGQPIYRRTRFSYNANIPDVFVKHDNIEELRAAYSPIRNTVSKMKPSEEFNI